MVNLRQDKRVMVYVLDINLVNLKNVTFHILGRGAVTISSTKNRLRGHSLMVVIIKFTYLKIKYNLCKVVKNNSLKERRNETSRPF